METLADWFSTDLRALSIGLNPSVNSVRDGFYFATPQNRFWRALNGSGLIDEVLEPGPVAMQVLLEKYRIGFTDVVKRPTASGSQLRVADFRQWSPVLFNHLQEYRPAVAWFHGKVAYRNFLKHTDTAVKEIEWGRQSKKVDGIEVFVTPNPSPANAVYTLADITAWYTSLKAMIDSQSS